MSGIVGVVSSSPVNQTLYDALLMLQHRGQDAAGIVVQSDRRFLTHKDRGMVRDVFRTRNMRALVGNCGLAQASYLDSRLASGEQEVPPFYTSAPFGVVLVHDGQLVNISAQQSELSVTDHRHINTDSDSEVLLGVLAHELETATRGAALGVEDVFRAVTQVHRRVRGAYAAIAHIAGCGMLAFRDPNGIRPLSFGRNAEGSVMVASETVALEGMGYSLERAVAPGEAVFVTLDGAVHVRQCAAHHQLSPCIFEYVYLARPDSVLDGVSVYQARLALGAALAKRVVAAMPPSEIDVVIPVPESSRPSANELARLLGKPYREGLVKNRYVGRTFIMPGQAVRRKSVRQKLNVIASEFAGRRVLLVDDSIVRGTTSREIVQMAREAGARRVYLASAAPPVRYPNVYGIDMPDSSEFVAAGHAVEEICGLIGADELIYQEISAMKQVIGALNPAIDRFDASCFDGDYVAGVPRSDAAHGADPSPGAAAAPASTAVAR